MRTSVYLFASDLIDEGFEAVLDNVAGRGGLGGINMAAAYHHGRDIFPHSPVRKVRFLEGGTVFFHPEESRYGETLRPVVSSLAADFDPLALRSGSGRTALDGGACLDRLLPQHTAWEHAPRINDAQRVR